MSYNKTIWKSKDIITREKMQKIEDQLEVLSEQGTSGSNSSTSDYLELENKPQINGVTLTGNKSLTDLGVAATSDVAVKYTKPGTGIPASDLSSTVQASLQKADTALQGENLTNVVNNYIETNFSNPSSPPLDRTLSSSASAAPADMVGDLKSTVADLQSGSLSALGATAGQVPTADGDGSWQWTSPDSDVELIHLGTETEYPLSAAHTVYPMGVTLIYTLASTSYPYSTGTVVTIRSANARCVQFSFGNSSDSYKLRTADSNGWSDWHIIGDFVVTVSGTTPAINAQAGVRYVCGELATLGITLPASGCVDVVFQSGSTPTVLTITPPTGVTIKWANGFDPTNPTSLEANATYEINIMNGLGVVVSWT